MSVVSLNGSLGSERAQRRPVGNLEVDNKENVLEEGVPDWSQRLRKGTLS